MADLRINTEAVVTAAGKIKDYNSQLRDEFSDVQNAINRLNNNWDGPASSNAIGKFNELRNDFFEARYNVMDNYVNYLLQQVGEGYVQTEDVNKSLADQFK